jgi:hypothetical protein
MATHAAKRQRVSIVRPLEDQVGLQILVILLLKVYARLTSARVMNRVF